MATFSDESYVKARAGLLDALDALRPLRQAVILVGAQAIYVQTTAIDADFAVSPFTYDSDIALDPDMLASEPKIVEAMQAASFNLTEQPGIYRRNDGVQVDLLVPESVGGTGRRGARLGVHGNRAAMKVRGLEGALVSHKSARIHSLSSADSRSYHIEVAGPAALLVAKVHKIAERVDESSQSRLNNKDAFDIYRLLRAIDTMELAAEARYLHEHEISREVTEVALSRFYELFGNPSAIGTQLVAQHLEGIEPLDFAVASSVSLSQDLLKAVEITAE